MPRHDPAGVRALCGAAAKEAAERALKCAEPVIQEISNHVCLAVESLGVRYG